MKRIQSVTITLLSLIMAGAAWLLPFSSVIDGLIYDLMLSSIQVSKQESEVIIIGIDDESLSRYREPLVMWHAQISDVIKSASEGGARSIGIDMIPAVSMERIAPGLDRRLMQAIRSATTRGTKVYLAFSVGKYGMMPENKFSLTASGLGYLNLFPDRDGIVRRQIVSMKNQEGQTAYSLALLLANSPVSEDSETCNDTYIDYGQPSGKIISLSNVLQLAEAQNTVALRDLFNEKIVLIGVTSPKLKDIHRVPLTLDIDDKGSLTGVQIHALMIQSIRDGAPRRDAPKAFNILLLTILGVLAGYFFLNWPPQRALLNLLGLVLLASLIYYIIFYSGYVLSASSALFGLLVPAATGLFVRLTREYHFTDSLNRFFRTYVDLGRLENIMANPRTRLRQEKQLRRAIERREPFVYYQPKVDVGDGSIVGMEALVRWIRPNGDFVSPRDFVSLAEETGLVNKLTEIVFECACSFARTLLKETVSRQKPIQRIAINLSARDLGRPDLIQYLQRTTDHLCVDPKQIDLEITESSFIHSMDAVVRKISSLKEAGFSISIDDFGTGFSSLGYITKIPFDNLKIDKSLIDHIAMEKRAYAVVSAIIAMSKSLGFRVIAEGVEHMPQLYLLKGLGCDQVQGYLFSCPIEENKMLELIKSGKSFDTSFPGSQTFSHIFC